MHVADILEVPMIALFGSTLVSKNGPLSPRARAIVADLECVPCQDTGRFFSCRHNECMHSLSVGDVMHEARRSLR
jgi:ADP-heptose:LPS heptosyltransferase